MNKKGIAMRCRLNIMCASKRHANRSMRETLYLTSTFANRKRLEEAIAEMNSGRFAEMHRH